MSIVIDASASACLCSRFADTAQKCGCTHHLQGCDMSLSVQDFMQKCNKRGEVYDLHVYSNALMKHYKLLSWQGEACMVKIISLSQSNLIVRLYSKVRQITSFRSWAFLSSIGEVISGFIKSSLDYTDFWLCTIIYNPKTVIFIVEYIILKGCSL